MMMMSPRTQESREDQAKREAGQTAFSPGVRLFLVALFLAIICAVPIIDQTLDWLQRRSPDDPFPRPQAFDLIDAVPTRTEAAEALERDGVFAAGYLMNTMLLRGMTAYEDALEDESRAAQWLLPPMQSLLIGWLGAGNEQAYCGRARWLFYRPEIDYLTGPGFLDPAALAARARRGDEWNPPPQPDPIKAILEFHDALAARGITLVLLPAPGKAMVYPERFSARYDGTHTLENPSFKAFKRAVEARGVLVCETAPTLLELKQRGTQSFLARDTHWSPEGARAAATVLAALLREKNVLPERAPAAYTRSETTLDNLGDIANMLNLPDNQTFYPEEQVTLQQVRTPDGETWKASEDTDILFLGDSYANIYSLAGMGWGDSAGIIEQLSAELERPIDTILMNDNGAYATRRQLSRELARGKDRLAGKSAVIYEFAARELASGDWKTGLPMTAQGTDSAVSAAQEPAANSAIPQLRVRATLKAKSTVPTPEEILPYTENLTVFEYQVDEVLFGTCGLPTLYVAHWGVRDGKPVTRTRQAKPGDIVQLSVERFEDHPDLEGVNLSDTIITDFSMPLLFDVGAQVPISPGLTQPLTMLGKKETSAVGPSVPMYGGFLSEELDARQADIQRELTRIEQLATRHGGWDAWLASREPYHDSIRTHVLQQDTVDLYMGNDGYVFSRSWDIRYLLSNTLGLNAPRLELQQQGVCSPFAVAVDLDRQLKTRNIHLIIVPVPPRSELEPARATLGAAFPGTDWVHPGRLQFIQALLSEDIEAVDVYPVLRSLQDQGIQVSMHIDSHYTPAAARAVAQCVAERIRRYGLANDPSTRVSFTVESQKLPYEGNLTKRWVEQTGKTPTEPESLPFYCVKGPDGKLEKNVKESPVLVVGDSCGYVFHEQSSDFRSLLSEQLGLRVAMLNEGGGGPGGARAIASQGPDGLSRRRVIVWIFVARYLDPPRPFDEKWRPVRLPEISGEISRSALTQGNQTASPSDGVYPTRNSKDAFATGLSPSGYFSIDETEKRGLAIKGDLQRVHQLAEEHGGWTTWQEAQRGVRATLQPFLSPEDKPAFYFGKEGFLFVRSTDLPYCFAETLGMKDPPRELFDAGARSPLSIMTKLNEDLMKRNIHLIVVPIPPRAEVDPECLVPGGDGVSGDWVHPARMRFLEALLQQDVEALDVLPVLRELKKNGLQASLKADSHFTPEAARAVAVAVALRIRRYAFTNDPTYRLELDTKETIVTCTGVYAKHYAEHLEGPQQERLPARAVLAADHKPIACPDSAPILVIGDSYAMVFDGHGADFVSQLSGELAFPVSCILSAGGGPKAPRAIARIAPEAFSKTRVIVWLFSARYLVPEPFMLREWLPAPLPETCP